MKRELKIVLIAVAVIAAYHYFFRSILPVAEDVNDSISSALGGDGWVEPTMEAEIEQTPNRIPVEAANADVDAGYDAHTVVNRRQTAVVLSGR